MRTAIEFCVPADQPRNADTPAPAEIFHDDAPACFHEVSYTRVPPVAYCNESPDPLSELFAVVIETPFAPPSALFR
jgi:hypothetical protein